MSELFDFNDGAFGPRGPIYPNPKTKRTSPISPFGKSHVDVFFPPRKRSRVSAPFVFDVCKFEHKKQPSIEILPDECLFEIFRRLPGGQEKSACACVSKHWLMLLSSIHRDEFCFQRNTQKLKLEEKLSLSEARESSQGSRKGGLSVSSGNEVIPKDGDMEPDDDGYLSRCLVGKKATDTRLAAIAVGASSRGGLGKLVIRGSNPTRGMTDFGLIAISRGCPSLRFLSLWKAPSVTDGGMFEIAKGCHQLEKLDLCQCPSISDKALLAIAKNCPELMELSIESCPTIENAGLQAISQYCPNLKTLSVKNCPLVGDQGIAPMLFSASCAVTKLKLHGLNITDISLAVIGHYGKTITDLVLRGLPMVSERGFWLMGNGQGLQKLKSLTIISCQGVTDKGFEALGKGCPNLKQVRLQRSAFLSDNGLVSFANFAKSLETVHLEECHQITQYGVFGLLASCAMKLKSLALANCLHVGDADFQPSLLCVCDCLRSISISGCPGFGDANLSILGKMCPQLQNMELNGLSGVTDAGVLSLIEGCKGGLAKVSLSSCVNMTDLVVSRMAMLNGGTLNLLNLNGCEKITDLSLSAIAGNCPLLVDLDLSECAITDSGIAALASAQLKLQILSVSGCSLITEKSLVPFNKLGAALVGLNLQHCNGISSSKVQCLMEQLWWCDILL